MYSITVTVKQGFNETVKVVAFTMKTNIIKMLYEN